MSGRSMQGHALIAAVLVAGLGRPAVATEPAERRAWSTLSHDGIVELKQTATGPDACHVACSREGGGAEMWSADACLATADQLRFVSNDGEKVVVIEPLPLKGRSWKAASVVSLYKRTELERGATAMAVVREADKVRLLDKHFYWLEGALDVPGRPPRYRPDGTGVEFESIDGRTHFISFDGSAFPRAPAPRPPPKSGKKKGR